MIELKKIVNHRILSKPATLSCLSQCFMKEPFFSFKKKKIAAELFFQFSFFLFIIDEFLKSQFSPFSKKFVHLDAKKNFDYH